MAVTKTGAALIGAALVVPLAIAAWLISRIFNDDIAGSPGAVSMMGTARWNHTATLLPNGKVLIVGGLGHVANAMMPVSLSSTELYDPSSNSWSPSGALAVAREFHTATLLPTGKVLVAGGKKAAQKAIMLLPALTSTIPPATRGRPPVVWCTHATTTRRPCCPAVRYWLRGELAGLD
jgi:hypothetical protein